MRSLTDTMSTSSMSVSYTKLTQPARRDVSRSDSQTRLYPAPVAVLVVDEEDEAEMAVGDLPCRSLSEFFTPRKEKNKQGSAISHRGWIRQQPRANHQKIRQSALPTHKCGSWGLWLVGRQQVRVVCISLLVWRDERWP